MNPRSLLLSLPLFSFFLEEVGLKWRKRFGDLNSVGVKGYQGSRPEWKKEGHLAGAFKNGENDCVTNKGANLKLKVTNDPRCNT